MLRLYRTNKYNLLKFKILAKIARILIVIPTDRAAGEGVEESLNAIFSRFDGLKGSLGYARDDSKIMSMFNNPISVVIPAYNEEKNISACLQSLAEQNTARPFEVILVNNNSTDNTAPIAYQFAERLRLQIIFEPRVGRGAARACGFARAQGEIILSTDADTVVPKDWVETLAGAAEKKFKASAISGAVVVTDLPGWRGYFFNWFWPKFNFSFRLFTGGYFLSGFNFGIYKNIYERVGGFNPNLSAWEDFDLGSRLNKFGKIIFLPSPAVAFSGRRFKGRMVLGVLEYAIEFIRYYLSGKKRGELGDVR